MPVLTLSFMAAAACSSTADNTASPQVCPADRDGSAADPNYDQAVAAVDSWIAQHPSGWSLQVSEADPSHGFSAAGYEYNCANGGPGATARLSSDGLELLLHFDCSILSATTIEHVRSAYRDATIDALPLGIDMADWDFRYVTPVSSFKAGVEFVRWENGLLEVHIDTMMYAIYGHSELSQCQAPADGDTPACCHLKREHRQPLSLSVSATFDPSVLK